MGADPTNIKFLFMSWYINVCHVSLLYRHDISDDSPMNWVKNGFEKTELGLYSGLMFRTLAVPKPWASILRLDEFYDFLCPPF